MSELVTKVLDFLADKTEPVPTLQIAKHVCGEKATKKSINPTMYAMARDGFVRKIAEENGSNPRWELV